VLYVVRMEDGKYVLEAGAAHGITDGAEFLVYQEQDSPPRTPPLGTLVACNVTAFSATMDFPPDAIRFVLAQPAFALQTKSGTEEDLRLHVAMNQRFINVFQELAREMERSGPNHRRFLLVERGHAELDIDLEDGQVVFNILNPLVTKYGLVRMPFQISPDDHVDSIIRAAAHYHWHLRRHGTNTLQDGVQIEFKALEHDINDKFHLIYRPTGPNLNKGGVVDIVVDSNRMYCIKIINNTTLALYGSLFFFDNSDLSIREFVTYRRITADRHEFTEPYYQPPTTGKDFKVDPPLPPKQSLTIGFGDGGSVPFTYGVRDGQNVDVGFLKLFLTTEHVDFSNVPQSSPFNQVRVDREVQSKITSRWDTMLVTVVQRRA
jgi:hypothetical protein